MYSSLRSRFGIPGVIAVMALVFAMIGGAYAASGGLSAKQKKEVKAIAKQFAGKPGAAGAEGKQGAPGANGKDGANGTNGTNGKDGTNGTNGEDGASVIGAPISCEGRDGFEYEVEGSGEAIEVCNGKEGSPWTAGGTLPPGATETGVWSFNGTDADTAGIDVPISFPIPLAEELEEGDAKYVPEFGDGVTCLGSIAHPTAPSGKLCVYGGVLTNSTFEILLNATKIAENSASTAGAQVHFKVTGPGVASGYGAWAVTG